MCWMLLSTAMGLAYELGVFDDIDELLNGPRDCSFGDEPQPAGSSRGDSPNKRALERALNARKVRRQSNYYEIELAGQQGGGGNKLSYVLAVGATIGAVGAYVASQTVKRGLGLLRWIK